MLCFFLWLETSRGISDRFAAFPAPDGCLGVGNRSREPGIRKQREVTTGTGCVANVSAAWGGLGCETPPSRPRRPFRRRPRLPRAPGRGSSRRHQTPAPRIGRLGTWTPKHTTKDSEDGGCGVGVGAASTSPLTLYPAGSPPESPATCPPIQTPQIHRTHSEEARRVRSPGGVLGPDKIWILQWSAEWVASKRVGFNKYLHETQPNPIALKGTI